MVQHLLLIMVAAPLFAIASPLELAWRSTTGTAHLVVTEALRSRVAEVPREPHRGLRALRRRDPGQPPDESGTTSRSSTRACTTRSTWRSCSSGYLFWRQIFGNDPNEHRLHPALQFFYLFMAIPIDTFTGLSLAGASQELFPAYFATHRTWGPSYVTDLHVGGDIMWVVGDTLMLWPMIPVALRWMHMDERRAVRIDRELDAQALAEAAAAGPVPDQPPRSISSTRTPSGSVQ